MQENIETENSTVSCFHLRCRILKEQEDREKEKTVQLVHSPQEKKKSCCWRLNSPHTHARKCTMSSTTLERHTHCAAQQRTHTLHDERDANLFPFHTNPLRRRPASHAHPVIASGYLNHRMRATPGPPQLGSFLSASLSLICSAC